MLYYRYYITVAIYLFISFYVFAEMAAIRLNKRGIFSFNAKAIYAGVLSNCFVFNLFVAV